MILRNYQQSIYNQVKKNTGNCVFQLDTGGGKTAIIAKLNDCPTINIAHRNMLIEQISNTLTNTGISHQIIGNSQITKRCQLYQRNHGVDYAGDIYVGTIQSIVSRYKRGKLNIDTSLPYQIIIDEAHHVANGNMWASVKEIFPNARFIGCTATPCRLDGRGMHIECGGLYDTLIQAEQFGNNSVAWLIANGYLADYKAYCPPIIDMSEFAHHKKKWLDREFSKSELDKWAEERITLNVKGLVVLHYKKLADNKTAIIFAPTIEVADKISLLFQKEGYSATYIASSLSFVENMRRIDAFKNGDVRILCNVEMATEGFDLPSAECLIILRPTASFVLHKQMIGRVLRPKPNNQHAIIIDHVGNIHRHGLPDEPVAWSLDGTPKNHHKPVAPCDNCNFVHNVYLRQCPNCGQHNWMRSIDAEDARAVRLGMVDVTLVRKVRQKLIAEEIEAVRIQAQQQQEQALSEAVVICNSFHDYPHTAIGALCKKLSYWFVDNIQKTDIPIRDINKVTACGVPMHFWTNNFTIKDLKNDNPEKCKRVLKKWLKLK